MLTENEALERIREFEARYDLYQYTIAGWSVWSILRGGLHLSLSRQGYDILSPEQKLNKILKAGAHVFREIPAVLFPRRARIVAKTVSTNRRERVGDLYKDVVLDDFLLENGPCYKIEELNGDDSFRRRNRQALIKSDITTTGIDLLAGGLSTLGGTREAAPLASRLSRLVQQEFDLPAFSPRRMALAIHFFYWQVQAYTWLLHRVQPEMVVTASHTDYPLLAAARSLGVKSIEFAHGIFAASHPAALNASAAAHCASLIKPQRIFVWGQYWVDDHKANGFYREELRAVGTTQMDRYRQKKAEYQACGVNADCQVTLSVGISVPETIQMVKGFLSLADGRLPLQLNIKLHPAYGGSQALFEEAFGRDKRVRIIPGSDQPSIYDLLACSDFHLSINSSSHYDALGLKVPTIILALSNYEIVLALYEAGHAFLACSPQELFDLVQANWKTYSVPDAVSEYYYKPGALENMRREMASISP